MLLVALDSEDTGPQARGELLPPVHKSNSVLPLQALLTLVSSNHCKMENHRLGYVRQQFEYRLFSATA